MKKDNTCGKSRILLIKVFFAAVMLAGIPFIYAAALFVFGFSASRSITAVCIGILVSWAGVILEMFGLTDKTVLRMISTVFFIFNLIYIAVTLFIGMAFLAQGIVPFA